MPIPLTWPGSLFESLNLLDLVSLGVLAWTGWRVWAGRPRRLLLRYRWRALGPLGVTRRQVQYRVADLLAGATPSVAAELDWLLGCLAAGGTAAGRGSLAADASLPFADAKVAKDVASAYAAYAARLDRGVLLGSDQVPVVRRDGDLARRLATWLDARHRARALPATELLLRVPARSLTLELLGGLAPRDVLVSYRPHRLVGLDGGGPSRCDRTPLKLSESERAELERAVDRPDTFDGSLPRLVGWRTERDLTSGRTALHLSLAETTYSAVLADHYPRTLATVSNRPADGETVRLLTLSMSLITSCGRVAFAHRSSRAGSHRGRFGPAVNGNLEFESRRGLVGDLDEFGMPDLPAALAREAREELGLDLALDSIAFLGLSRFWCPEEQGTFVLLACAPVDLTLAELLDRGAFADQVEGAWELDRQLLGLPIPRDDRELRASLGWLLGGEDLTPHATLAGLAALAASTRLGNVAALAQQALADGLPAIPSSAGHDLGRSGGGLRLVSRSAAAGGAPTEGLGS